jgi:outer membrane protein assembly factor BamD
MMKRTIILFSVTVLLFASGCSSIPSISMPWSSNPQPDPTAEAVFNRGMELFNNKKYVAALDQFTRIKQEFPFAPQAIHAELKITECYYLNQQYPEAITALKEFQSMHPTNENIPLVIYRLGLAHFDQFSAADRDQKNTEIAKGYFETVINTYPKSPYAAEAKEKLGKAIGYLVEHDFNIAYFYFQQEKYPAARDRFEEIVRRYRGTPIAAKSLFYLGESYRKEKNGIKAALAYESILQHYPKSKFANDAQNELAALEKEKHDPLAMLLMRDRRPGSAPTPQNNTETAGAAKLKGIDNLVAKSEVVYEEPGEEKGLFRRVVDKLNPFSSSDDGKKSAPERKKPEGDAALVDALTKKNAAQKKEESPGVFASLWNGINPFSRKDPENIKQVNNAKNGQLVASIDDSLKGKGIDANNSSEALKPPPAALPEIIEAPVTPPITDASKLLGQIDSGLQKEGKAVAEPPSPPEAAEVFKDPAAAQAMAKKGSVKSEPSPGIASTGLLGSIDDKLKSKGVEPSDFELPASDVNAPAGKKEPVKKVELDPKISLEKGPLFLGPLDIPAREKPASGEQADNQGKGPESSEKPQEPGTREIPKALVRGPNQPQPVAPAPKASSDQNRSNALGEDEEKDVLDQLRENAEAVGKILNPFNW